MSKLEEAQVFFAQDQYAVDATGCVIEALDEKYAKCSLLLDRRHYNAVGQIMGGVAFTLADFTFAVATNFQQGITVSVTSQICYLGTVKGNKLIAETRLIKDGKRNCFYEVDVTDDLGNPIALVSITGAHL